MGIEFNGDLHDHVCQNFNLKKKLVFDIGSNVGKMTKKFIDAGAKVVSIEPQKELTFNKNYENVIAIENICISDKIGEIIFYQGGKAHNVSTCYKNWNKHHPKTKWNKMKLRCITLDSLIEKYGIPYYIKIDVEGYENKVISGLSNKIDLISFEFTEGFENNFIDCINLIEKFQPKKILTFQNIKIKRKKKIPGKNKVLRRYCIVDKFSNIESVVDFYRNLPERIQGDILIQL